MTREERIDWLCRLRCWVVPRPNMTVEQKSKCIEALTEVIDDLQTEHCEDAISRSELLKAINTWDKFGFEHTGCFVREPKDDFVTYVHYDDVVKCIKGMPSVQPTACIAKISFDDQQMKEMIDKAISNLDFSDCISRQAAIDELVRWGAIPEYNEAEKNILACCIGMLSTLPSVQPKSEDAKFLEFLVNTINPNEMEK